MPSLQLTTRGSVSYLGAHCAIYTVTGYCVSTGYAVTAGHFSAPNMIDIAAGAPQHSGSGKVRSAPFGSHPDVDLQLCLATVTSFSPTQVYIFKIDGSSLVRSFQASGKMVRNELGLTFQFIFVLIPRTARRLVSLRDNSGQSHSNRQTLKAGVWDL